MRYVVGEFGATVELLLDTITLVINMGAPAAAISMPGDGAGYQECPFVELSTKMWLCLVI